MLCAHTLYVCAHCVVWLVFLDPQCSIDHAETPTTEERLGKCGLDHGEPPWSRTLQLAPGGRLGPQSVPGQWGMENTKPSKHTGKLFHNSVWTGLPIGLIQNVTASLSFSLFFPLIFFFFFLLTYSATLDWMTCFVSLLAAGPGHVSWWTLHREAGQRGHAEVQEAAGRDKQLHQEEERGKEAAVLLHVPWQNPKQCCCLMSKTHLISATSLKNNTFKLCHRPDMLSGNSSSLVWSRFFCGKHLKKKKNIICTHGLFLCIPLINM